MFIIVMIILQRIPFLFGKYMTVFSILILYSNFVLFCGA